MATLVIFDNSNTGFSIKIDPAMYKVCFPVLEKVELHKKHLGPSFINCRSVTCLARQLKIVTQSSDDTLWIKNHIDLNYKTFVVISQDPIYISETAKKKVDFYIYPNQNEFYLCPFVLND